MTERVCMAGLALLLLAACRQGEPDGNADDTPVAGAQAPERTAPATAPAGPPPAAPASREPIGYTSLKPADCRLIERNADEAGYARHRCRGIAGYALETSESDLRHDIVVIAPDRRKTELGLSGKVAKGAFNALGGRAEWRGADGKTPMALIVRMGVADGTDPSRPDVSNLVVIRLKPRPCVIRVIPPDAGQNDRARDAADRLDGACL